MPEHPLQTPSEGRFAPAASVPSGLAGFIRRCFVARRLHRRADVANATMADLIDSAQK